MNIRAFLLVILISFSGYITAGAQNILRLDKARPIRYIPGTPIKVQLRTDNQKIEGLVRNIGSDYIEVDDYTIPLNDISAVYVIHDEINNLAHGQKLIVAGVGFLAITGLNSLIINHTAVTAHYVYPVSATLIATGIVFDILKERRVKINGKHTLKILSLSP